MPPFDLVIRGADLYDGTGAPPVTGDLAVEGGRIAALGSFDPARAAGAPALDGRGLALASGFVDVHTHDDFATAGPFAGATVLDAAKQPILGAPISASESGFDHVPEPAPLAGGAAALGALARSRKR